MNADAFRHLYAYHFSSNRHIWDQSIMGLTEEQFLQENAYSLGSIRNHLIHIINVDEAWFSDIRRVPLQIAEWPKHKDMMDRQAIRAYGDAVEQDMRAYLDTLEDAMLFEKPIDSGEDKDLFLWQILLQVANHGTDHRAQILRLLHDLGVKTDAQDYIFYAYDHAL